MAVVPPYNSESWCHLQETMTMLQLTSAQIRSSMMDGHNSISELTAILGTIAEHGQKLNELLAENCGPTKHHADELMANVHRGIVACQFHDRVTQRLDHVTNKLSQIADLVTHPEDFSNAEKWQMLQEEVRQSYTMESEKLMYEQIMMGRTVEEALEIYRHHFTETHDDEDEVELF